MTDLCFVVNTARRINIQKTHPLGEYHRGRRDSWPSVRMIWKQRVRWSKICVAFCRSRGELGKEENGVGRWRYEGDWWRWLDLCVDQEFLRAVYGWYTSVGGIFSGRNIWVWWNWRLISRFRRLHGVLKWPYMTCIGNVFEWFAYRIVQSLGESFLVNSIKPPKTIKDYSKLKTQQKHVSSSQNPRCFWRNLRFVFSTQP